MKKTALRGNPKGFSLLEVLIATAILALVFSYLTGGFIQGGYFLAKTPRYTQSSLLIRSVVLDLEEEYRKEGFPENDLTNRNCDLPREAPSEFKCTYDLEKLELDAGQLAEMASGVLESLMSGISEQGSVLQAFQSLAFLFVLGDVPISPLCPATPSQFLSMCQINLAAIERNIMGMVHFFPQIITQAAERTRKLRVKMMYADDVEPIMEIETFIISIPENVEAMMEEGMVPGSTGSVPPSGTSGTTKKSTSTGGSGR